MPAESIPASLFGMVKRIVGALIEGFLAFPFEWESGDANAAPDLKVQTLVMDGSGHRPQKPFTESFGRGKTAHGKQKDRKFISSQPGHAIGVTHFGLDARCGFYQDCIAGIMSECVVHIFEEIEIDQQKRKGIGTSIRLQPSAEFFHKHATV
jgi:hypothetical protein